MQHNLRSTRLLYPPQNTPIMQTAPYVTASDVALGLLAGCTKDDDAGAAAS